MYKTEIDELVKMIKTGTYKNIVVMTGAGISNESGIPDLHSISSDLMNIADNLMYFDVEGPEFVFDIRFFMRDPRPFWWVFNKLWPWDWKPQSTDFHYLIRALNSMHILRRWYTTNIDGLEISTGIDPKKLVLCHGGLCSCHCIDCGMEIDLDDCLSQLNHDSFDFDSVTVPVCKYCGGEHVKPDVTFFGEQMPEHFFTHINEDFKKCDMLIISGSSLNVHPFSSLITRVDPDIPVFVINHRNSAKIMESFVHKENNTILSYIRSLISFNNNGRYHFIGGDLQENARILAKKLNLSGAIEHYKGSNIINNINN